MFYYWHHTTRKLIKRIPNVQIEVNAGRGLKVEPKKRYFFSVLNIPEKINKSQYNNISNQKIHFQNITVKHNDIIHLIKQEKPDKKDNLTGL